MTLYESLSIIATVLSGSLAIFIGYREFVTRHELKATIKVLTDQIDKLDRLKWPPCRGQNDVKISKIIESC